MFRGVGFTSDTGGPGAAVRADGRSRSGNRLVTMFWTAAERDELWRLRREACWAASSSAAA